MKDRQLQKFIIEITLILMHSDDYQVILFGLWFSIRIFFNMVVLFVLNGIRTRKNIYTYQWNIVIEYILFRKTIEYYSNF